jgi:pimeloyl-ACP methyl ester carboxylesterase
VQSLHAVSYAEGIEIAESLKGLDGPNVNPVCQTRLYTHGHRTERSLVLLHGFTNCPAQFDQIGKEFFERGWNVLIPRYPRHGYSDRMNTSIAELRSEHLIAIANRAALSGSGLGERLTVVGLSLGAILTGYLAQTRTDMERAVLVAPMFGLRPIPGPALAALSEATAVLPNFYIWWNAKAKDRIGPPHGYPRFATHAYAALFRTGRKVMGLAARSAPLAGSIAVITNAAEPRLDNRFTYQLTERWRRHGAIVETFEFAAHEGLPHDLIDPVSNSATVTERSYPVLRRFIEGASWSVPKHEPLEHPAHGNGADASDGKQLPLEGRKAQRPRAAGDRPRRKPRRAKQAAEEQSGA